MLGHLSAIRLMKGSENIAESAFIHESLDEAIGDYHYTFVTSHRMKQSQAFDIVRGAKKIAQLAGKKKVALIFGSEKHGLSKEDVEKADGLIALPVVDDFPSLNLSMAVAMLCLQVKIEMSQVDGKKNLPNIKKEITLPKSERERFYKYCDSLFKDVGLENQSIIKKIRAIFDRANLAKEEQNLLFGLVKELKKINGK